MSLFNGWDDYKLLSKEDKERINFEEKETEQIFMGLIFISVAIGIGFINQDNFGFIMAFFLFVMFIICSFIYFYKGIRLSLIKEEAKKKIKIKR